MPDLAGALRLSPERTHTLYNGALECKLLHFAITTAAERSARAARVFEIVPGSGAEMFANRLRKDLRHYGRWARKQEIFAWRLYDADMHEYNLAIDVYDCGQRYVHVQEYEAPDTIEPNTASARLKEALQVIPLVLEIPREQLFFKVRRRQRGGSQYEKQDERGEFHAVREGPCRFLVNFTDYLDTGLFLDHRDTRALVGTLARDKHFLNLFGYTGTATVHAALNGARATTTVDMSNTYLDWAQRNFELNGMRPTSHELIQADVLKWLSAERGRQFDLIFLDPPTFSRSKRMDDTLDIQRDHVALLRATAALLAPDGTLIFSTNLRKFRLDRDALPALTVEDITRRTIPEDFKRNPKIHHCFRIARAGGPL
jgi:23S rRNA (guanine2445-N2)-methyltransferase / 23S rRNA (guanine2069-N7)-methyltransferase